jgi:hypothetical protein
MISGHLQVSELGYVSMHTEPSTRLYLNRNFPFNGTVYDRIVAAFWNNLCIDFSASVHYLNTTRKGNEDLFRTIDATIASRTSQECANFPFEAQWALIVTWEDITSYYYVNRFNSEPVVSLFLICWMCVCMATVIYCELYILVFAEEHISTGSGH